MPPADIERLETLLWERAVPNQGMPLEMLDGYFSALAVGPELVPPSESSRLVWGNPAPEWKSVDEAADAFHLLHAYWNHVVDRLGYDPDADLPNAMPAIMMSDGVMACIDAMVADDALPASLSQEDRDFPLGSAWALGFFLGVELRDDAWEDWSENHDFVDLHLARIEELLIVPPDAGEADDEDADDDDDEDEDEQDDDWDDEDEDWSDDDEDWDDEDDPPPPTLLERIGTMFQLPYMLRELDTLRRSEQLRAQGPVRRDPTPGRNDPCHCGSGKKYKKCHGDPGRQE